MIAIHAMLFAMAWAVPTEVVHGELLVQKGNVPELKMGRSSAIRGIWCLSFKDPSLEKSPWIVSGLRVEARVQRPSTALPCLLVESMRPVVFDPGGATIRQGPQSSKRQESRSKASR